MKQTNGVLWDEAGPRLKMTSSLMRNGDGDGPLRVLYISDLNPETHLAWCFPRSAMIRIGIWFIWRAIWPNQAG
jgi:hypothetical protein